MGSGAYSVEHCRLQYVLRPDNPFTSSQEKIQLLAFVGATKINIEMMKGYEQKSLAVTLCTVYPH